MKTKLIPHPYTPPELLNETQALKRVVISELIDKVREAYGVNAFVLMSEKSLLIVRGKLQGLVLLSAQTELEVVHEFPTVASLEIWMRNEKLQKPNLNPDPKPEEPVKNLLVEF